MASTQTSVKTTDLPGKLPVTQISKDVDLSSLPSLVESVLSQLTPAHLTEEALWRDWFLLTGGRRTIAGGQQIAETWAKLCSQYKASDFKASSPRLFQAGPTTAWVDVSYTLKVSPNGLLANGSGVASLVPHANGQSWQIWKLTSIVEHFDGQPNPDKPVIPDTDKPTILRATADNLGVDRTYEVIIAGGGHNGLAFSGYLQALGIPYIMLERRARIGDRWRDRYDSVRVHTPKEFNELPFARSWPADLPVYPTGKEVADDQEHWAEQFKIHARTSAGVEMCEWDEASREWLVRVRGEGFEATLRGKELALATGQLQGVPKWPAWPGRQAFRGKVLHSSEFHNVPQLEGAKRAVVVGCGASGFDIAEDLVKAGLEVTMVQRNPTPVAPLEWIDGGIRSVWNSDNPTSIADRFVGSNPVKVGLEFSAAEQKHHHAQEPDRFTALEQAGFKVDRDTVLIGRLLETFSGYYIDVGGTKLIEDGLMKAKSGVAVSHFTPTGLAFADGSELVTDVICLATGYEGGVEHQMKSIVGKDLARRVGPVWGVNPEGEMNGIMKHVAGVPLWILAGGLGYARWESRFVAMHVQARTLGHPMKHYDE